MSEFVKDIMLSEQLGSSIRLLSEDELPMCTGGWSIKCEHDKSSSDNHDKSNGGCTIKG